MRRRDARGHRWTHVDTSSAVSVEQRLAKHDGPLSEFPNVDLEQCPGVLLSLLDAGWALESMPSMRDNIGVKVYSRGLLFKKEVFPSLTLDCDRPWAVLFTVGV